jgi:hypothetical protein
MKFHSTDESLGNFYLMHRFMDLVHSRKCMKFVISFNSLAIVAPTIGFGGAFQFILAPYNCCYIF